jgi:hypothetical protein
VIPFWDKCATHPANANHKQIMRAKCYCGALFISRHQHHQLSSASPTSTSTALRNKRASNPCLIAALMEFNFSISQVSHWLDTLPFDQSPPSSSEVAQARALKRGRSVKRNEPRKRRYPVSPPESHAQGSKSSDEMLPATPVKRTQAHLDHDQTPRAEMTSANPLTNAPNLSSKSEASSFASRSDASMSRDSKRSKRSQSPTKLFPMYGPDGHRLVRDSLSMTAPQQNLPQTLSALFRDINDVAGRYGIIPGSIKGVLDQHLARTMSLDRVHDHMFFDDTSGVVSLDESLTWATEREILRRALRIADRSSHCSRMLSDESAWNNLVHSPLLDLFVYDMYNTPRQPVLDFIPW